MAVKKIEVSTLFRRIKQSSITYNHIDVNIKTALHMVKNNVEFNIVYVKSDELGNLSTIDEQGDKVISAIVSLKEIIEDDFILNTLLDKEIFFSVFNPNDEIIYKL